MTMTGRMAPGLLVLATACGPSAGAPGEDATTGTTGSSSADVTGPGTDSPATSATVSSTTTAETDTGGACQSGAPALGECDLWCQDCPEGEKCLPLDTDADGKLDATRCRPVVPRPNAPGEPCSFDFSGVDDCEKGSLCWGQGTCVELCAGSPDDPVCQDPLRECLVLQGGLVPICHRACDPVMQDCPFQQCIPWHPDWSTDADCSFGCFPMDERGTLICAHPTQHADYGYPCGFPHGCNVGLCALAEDVPGCRGGRGCCSTFCDLDDPSADENCPGFADGQRCMPLFEPGAAPPGRENAGGCLVP